MTVSLYAWVVGYATFLVVVLLVLPRVLAYFFSETPPDMQYVTGVYAGFGFLTFALASFFLIAIFHVGWVGHGLYFQTLTFTQGFVHICLPIITALFVYSFFFGLPFTRQFQSIDPTAIGSDGYSILFDIVAENDMSALQEMVKKGADVNTLGFANETPILRAALANNWEVVLFLLENGAHIDAYGTTGFTLPNLVQLSRMTEQDPEYAALQRVQEKIDAANITHWRDYPPTTVEAMIEDGTWPPPKTDSETDSGIEYLYAILPVGHQVSGDEIAKVLSALETARLKHNEDSPQYRHAKPITDYALQIIYNTEHSDAPVVIQGIPQDQANTDAWKTDRIYILDGGGNDYFDAQYDRNSKEIISFFVNGES